MGRPRKHLISRAALAGAVVVAEEDWRGCVSECPSCGSAMEVPTKAAALKGMVARRVTATELPTSGRKSPWKPLKWIVCALAFIICIGAISQLRNRSAENSQRSPDAEGISDREAEILLRSVENMGTRYPCPVCDGKGEVVNTTVRQRTGLTGSSEGWCETCHGNGSIRTPSGYDAVCPTCGGLGSKKTSTCHKCQGSGVVWR
jgi:ssDNA-binding Zn-finger/Zn-ribbon topoisomerase 1